MISIKKLLKRVRLQTEKVQYTIHKGTKVWISTEHYVQKEPVDHEQPTHERKFLFLMFRLTFETRVSLVWESPKWGREVPQDRLSKVILSVK